MNPGYEFFSEFDIFILTDEFFSFENLQGWNQLVFELILVS